MSANIVSGFHDTSNIIGIPSRFSPQFVLIQPSKFLFPHKCEPIFKNHLAGRDVFVLLSVWRVGSWSEVKMPFQLGDCRQTGNNVKRKYKVYQTSRSLEKAEHAGRGSVVENLINLSKSWFDPQRHTTKWYEKGQASWEVVVVRGTEQGVMWYLLFENLVSHRHGRSLQW